MRWDNNKLRPNLDALMFFILVSVFTIMHFLFIIPFTISFMWSLFATVLLYIAYPYDR